MFRIGIGYDSHRLALGRRLVLGGVDIPARRGLVGHSDGDVLLHSVSDALLGALGGPDIGELFPDSDPGFKDADSAKLLRQVYARLKRNKARIVNIDSVIIAVEPKIVDYKQKMRSIIARILSLKTDRVNIKGKRPEGLGRAAAAAISAYAVAIIEAKPR
ncbi:MAG: 2-C-methyl-D-erythritol 2,4-cyclodiphosphate synthase [Candidatus Omnitrophota bacterium]